MSGIKTKKTSQVALDVVQYLAKQYNTETKGEILSVSGNLHNYN